MNSQPLWYTSHRPTRSWPYYDWYCSALVILQLPCGCSRPSPAKHVMPNSFWYTESSCKPMTILCYSRVAQTAVSLCQSIVQWAEWQCRPITMLSYSRAATTAVTLFQVLNIHVDRWPYLMLILDGGLVMQEHYWQDCIVSADDCVGADSGAPRRWSRRAGARFEGPNGTVNWWLSPFQGRQGLCSPCKSTISKDSRELSTDYPIMLVSGHWDGGLPPQGQSMVALPYAPQSRPWLSMCTCAKN